MDLLADLLSFFLHLDQHLAIMTSQYGGWIYAILFLIVFCETGLVVTPFLPGDSLLFATGALAAIGAIDIHAIFLLLTVAAILGDTVNYAAGRYLVKKYSAPTPAFSSANTLTALTSFLNGMAARPL